MNYSVMEKGVRTTKRSFGELARTCLLGFCVLGAGCNGEHQISTKGSTEAKIMDCEKKGCVSYSIDKLNGLEIQPENIQSIHITPPEVVTLQRILEVGATNKVVWSEVKREKVLAHVIVLKSPPHIRIWVIPIQKSTRDNLATRLEGDLTLEVYLFAGGHLRVNIPASKLFEGNNWPEHVHIPGPRL